MATTPSGMLNAVAIVDGGPIASTRYGARKPTPSSCTPSSVSTNALDVPTRTGPNCIASAPDPRSSSTTSRRSSADSLPCRVVDGQRRCRGRWRAACRCSTPSASAFRSAGVPRRGVVAAAGVELAQFALQLLDLALQTGLPVVQVVQDADQVVWSRSGQRVRGRDRPNLDGDGEAEGRESAPRSARWPPGWAACRGRASVVSAASTGVSTASAASRGGRGRLRPSNRELGGRSAPGFPRLRFRAHVSGSLQKRGASYGERFRGVSCVEHVPADGGGVAEDADAEDTTTTAVES